MYDAKDCLENIKRMHRPSIIDKVIGKKCDKYKTESKRYNAIYEEITKCSSQERDNLEVLLECEKDTANRFMGFKGLVTVFISVVSVIISIGSSFIIKLIDLSNMEGNSEKLGTLMSYVLGIAGGIAVLAIVIYAGLDIYGGRSLSKTTYLLGVLEKSKESKQRRQIKS